MYNKARSAASRTLALILVLLIALSCLAAAPISVSAATGDGTCDLIVTDVMWTPSNPVNGDAVLFSAVVKNQGSGATPSGVTHGVRFDINSLGDCQSWSGDYSASIPAGGSVTLTASSGPYGSMYWTCGAETSYTVYAYVDDADRINETDKTNNIRTETLTANQAAGQTGACDLTVSSITAYPSATETVPSRMLMTVENNGPNAAAAGASIRVYIDGRPFEAFTTTSAIAAGESVSLSTSSSWMGVVGTHAVTAIITSNDDTNSGNNSKVQRITVRDSSYAAQATTTTATTTTTTVIADDTPKNLAYGKNVYATSVESDEHAATNINDGKGSTRWSSAYADEQSIIVDLGGTYSVFEFKLRWEAAYASQYQIQISSDNSTWTTVYENYNATGGMQEISISAVSAKYVKIYCIRRATEYGFSLYEFEIYGQRINSNAKTNIEGKTFFFLGSSVTYGYSSGGVSFVDYIAQRNNCTCIKEAVSGTTLVDNGSTSYVQRMLNNFDPSARCSHFICQLSTNDASQNMPLGSLSSSYNLSDFNTSTIIGAIEYITCYAKNTWNCPVTFYTSTYFDSPNYQQMVDALYKVQEKWGIGIIDLWNNEEMRNVSSYDYSRYMADNIHPTATGYLEWWTPEFEEYLQNFDYSEYEEQVNDAAKAKEEVLDYLYEIQGKQTIIGMHNREPNSDPDKQSDQAYAVTGRYPALWSGDFLFSSSDVANRWTMIYECQEQWENGAIVQLMLHVTPPTQSEAGNWDGGVVSNLSDSQWSSLITDGGELNRAWKQRLDGYATYIQYLEDNGVPILFRPFHEMNQGVFWWAGRTGSNGTAALYRLTRDYLENEKGLDNIIWVWDMQDLSYNWSDYNPGNDYWDVFAVDVYNPDYFTTYKYNQALSVAGGKPIAIGECDKLPTANELLAQPRWCFVMSWAELTFSHNSNSEISALYNANNVITRDELPSFR